MTAHNASCFLHQIDYAVLFSRPTRVKNPALQRYVEEREESNEMLLNILLDTGEDISPKTLLTSLFQSPFSNSLHFESMVFSCSDPSNNSTSELNELCSNVQREFSIVTFGK